MIYLTIVMVLAGKPSEESYSMQTLQQCWELAQSRVVALREAHPDATKIGAGCTIDLGIPL